MPKVTQCCNTSGASGFCTGRPGNVLLGIVIPGSRCPGGRLGAFRDVTNLESFEPLYILRLYSGESDMQRWSLRCLISIESMVLFEF